MDGEGRRYHQGRGIFMCPACHQEEDGWRHWIFRCPATKVVREGEWGRVKAQVGEWVEQLREEDRARLVAGRFPKQVRVMLKQKEAEKVRIPGERYGGEEMRVQDFHVSEWCGVWCAVFGALARTKAEAEAEVSEQKPKPEPKQ